MMDKAVRSGDLKLVEELFLSGTNVNESCRLRHGEGSLLILAIEEGHQNIALALLAAGADVQVRDVIGWTALHWACRMGFEEVVRALVDRGSRVNERDNSSRTPLVVAEQWRETAISMRLLRAGASCKGLLPERRVNDLFLHACHERDLSAVRTLLKGGCSLRKLKLSQADHIYLARNLSKQEVEELLCSACREGDVFAVKVLLANGCNINCALNGYSPLMDATLYSHEEVVKTLILAGANLEMQTPSGDTALHLAASGNSIQCGVLLVDGGASVASMNNFLQTPLDLAKTVFKEAITHALNFTSRKSLCIIGNAESGKSTLIASLQAESNSILGKFFNRYRRVDDHRQRTAGIETVSHCSQKYGEVLFFDFAGQDDYHGPHQMFLESFLSKPGVSMTLMLVVKMTEEEESILHQLHRWLSPVALMATPANPPHVIIIGSFLDKVKSKDESTAKLARCIEATRKDLEELPLEFVGSCFLNCRQPQSEGIDQICNFLQDVSTPEFRATHTHYSLAWVLYEIKSSITAQAVQLQAFSTWVQRNKDNLPWTMPPPEEVCQDLSAAGHALYLPNKEDAPKSWLVLDLPSILHYLYGTLFSHSKELANEFGLLHCHHLAKLFPHLDLEMVQQLLISLEFCLSVDPSILKVDLSELTQSEEANGWLFFPALISAKPPQPTSEYLPQQSERYLCWQLSTSTQHSVSARLLQTILLRLAAHFVVKQRGKAGLLQQYCSVWWNGITWQSTDGVDVTVHIINNRVIQVIGATLASADKSCKYLTDVISDILSTVHRLSPKLAAGAYIVHPPIMETPSVGVTALPPKKLFPVEGIRSSIRDHKEFALSLKDNENCWNRVPVTDLFGGCTPSLEDIGKIHWPQPETNQTHSPTGPTQPELHTGAPTDSQGIPSGARALLDVSSTPDLRDVDELVVTAVAANWQRVALRLGVEGCVSEVVSKNHPNDCEGACRDMLNRWLRGGHHTGEEERTWSTLLTALGRAGFVELEWKLQREHFLRVIS